MCLEKGSNQLFVYTELDSVYMSQTGDPNPFRGTRCIHLMLISFLVTNYLFQSKNMSSKDKKKENIETDLEEPSSKALKLEATENIDLDNVEFQIVQVIIRTFNDHFFISSNLLDFFKKNGLFISVLISTVNHIGGR